MNKDQYQDKYDEIFKDLKEEKMNWDFEDFLQKAESSNNEAEIIPLHNKKPSFPKWFWMAASVVLIFGVGFIFNLNQNQNADFQDKAKLVESQIQKQKSDFIKENHEHEKQVAVNHDSISEAKKDSIFQENTLAEKDVLDEILSKKSRIKKQTKPRYVDNSHKKYNEAPADSTGYHNSYVIVNGKKIDNVEEAINITKYSFQVVANNVHQTLSQPKVMDNVDY